MPTTTWSPRLLTPADDEAMAKLSRLCFSERADSLAFIRSRYTDCRNPPAFVMAAEANGELIGTQAVTLLPFYVAGTETLGGMFTAGMTHPEFRRRGVFHAVVEACEQFAVDRGVAFLFTLPNDESFPSFQKSPTWRCLPDRPLFARPLSIRGFLADRRVPLARPIGSFAELLLQKRFEPASTVTELKNWNEYASSFDTLATEAGQACSGVMCRRDWSFLRWRFADNPTFRYRCFVVGDSEHLDGYLITTVEQRMGTHLVHIVDWLAPNRPNVLHALIDTAAYAARQDGCTLMTLIASDGIGDKSFRSAGFRRVSPRFAPRAFHTAVRPTPGRNVPELRRDDGWYFTLADFDTI